MKKKSRPLKRYKAEHQSATVLVMCMAWTLLRIHETDTGHKSRTGVGSSWLVQGVQSRNRDEVVNLVGQVQTEMALVCCDGSVSLLTSLHVLTESITRKSVE